MSIYKEFAKKILNIPQYNKEIHNRLDIYSKNNTDMFPHHSYIQNTLSDSLKHIGCCGLMIHNTGNFRTLIPHSSLKVSEETKDRWVEELKYLYGFIIDKESNSTVTKLVKRKIIPEYFIATLEEPLEDVLANLLELFFELRELTFPIYKKLVLKNLNTYLRDYVPHVYIDGRVIESNAKTVTSLVEDMELVPAKQVLANILSMSNTPPHNLGWFLEFIEAFKHPLSYYGGEFSAIGAATLYNYCGLVLDSQPDNSWLTTKAISNKRTVLLWSVPFYGSIDYNSYVLKRSVTLWGTSGSQRLITSFKGLSDGINEFIEGRKTDNILGTKMVHVEDYSLYIAKAINKRKLIPLTLIRALWTPVKREMNVHFIDKYFELREKYPQLDPYYLLNVTAIEYYASSYGNPTNHGFPLYLVPRKPEEDLIQSCLYKNRPLRPSSVISFYSEFNNVEGAVDMRALYASQGVGFTDTMIKTALKFYDN